MIVGSLCSGYGGLEMALGGAVAWHAETDPAAARVLAHHWPGVPNLGDITTTDWATVEPVDWLTAGYPCTPFSLAGKRKGTDDVRHLWPAVATAVGVLRPRYVLLENVSAHLRLGFHAVLGDLADLGYDARWGVVRASDAGAPHGRARLFVVAHAAGVGRGDGRAESAGQQRGSTDVLGGAPAADTDGQRGDGGRARGRRWPEPSHRGDAAADAGRQRVEGPGETGRPDPGLGPRAEGGGRPTDRCDWGPYGPAITRWAAAVGRPAPVPREPGRRGPRLSAAFVEWMQGLPAGWVTGVPGLSRNDHLRVLGNGVVPQQAALALSMLTNRAAA